MLSFDVYSRCIVGWGLYNTLDASNAIEVLERAIKAHGTPEIINSDQGCQTPEESGWRLAHPTKSRSVWAAGPGVWIIYG